MNEEKRKYAVRPCGKLRSCQDLRKRQERLEEGWNISWKWLGMPNVVV